MKIYSRNIRGQGDASRHIITKKIFRHIKVQIAMLQETKINVLADSIVREVWGSRYIKWISLNAVGTAGGILLLWDTRFVTTSDSWIGEFSTSIMVKDLTNNSKWMNILCMDRILIQEEMTSGGRRTMSRADGMEGGALAAIGMSLDFPVKGLVVEE